MILSIIGMDDRCLYSICLIVQFKLCMDGSSVDNETCSLDNLLLIFAFIFHNVHRIP